MKTLITPRGMGKTYYLIQRSAETKETIVCKDEEESLRITALASQMQVSIPIPITFEDFRKQNFKGRPISKFLIDNADMFIQSFSPKHKVELITLSDEEL